MIKQTFFLLLMLLCSLTIKAQLYFPPNTTTTWESIPITDLNWCQDKIDNLYNFLETNNTKAFIVLKDGKLVLEHYFNDHTATSNWYWASAGKTLTAFMVGIAQQENYLDISEVTANYLGNGWTSCTSAQENAITIQHQLTMTSGLNDEITDPYCTTADCLHYLADAGTRWAYHNAPYTLLDQVLENATGQSLNNYTTQKLKNITGMDGAYLQQGYNTVFFSTARSMARFGLLILNKGNWNGTPILTDANYYNQMVSTSQNLNESYGYLWWLNGKNSYMIPQSQMIFSGSMTPDAPNDMIAALGKNGQFINVIPSQQLVWIRMGEAPDNSLVSFTLNNEIWKYINQLDCGSLSTENFQANTFSFTISPNPSTDTMLISSNKSTNTVYTITNLLGQTIQEGIFSGKTHLINIKQLPQGIYHITLQNEKYKQSLKIIKE